MLKIYRNQLPTTVTVPEDSTSCTIPHFPDYISWGVSTSISPNPGGNTGGVTVILTDGLLLRMDKLLYLKML